MAREAQLEALRGMDLKNEIDETGSISLHEWKMTYINEDLQQSRLQVGAKCIGGKIGDRPVEEIRLWPSGLVRVRFAGLDAQNALTMYFAPGGFGKV